jgi:hypothetical protein
LIDLHESEAALMGYIRRHVHLDGPSTPALRDAVARSGARTLAEDEVIHRHTPWMIPADHGRAIK